MGAALFLAVGAFVLLRVFWRICLRAVYTTIVTSAKSTLVRNFAQLTLTKTETRRDRVSGMAKAPGNCPDQAVSRPGRCDSKDKKRKNCDEILTPIREIPLIS